MEIHFTPEQEAQITQAARASGTDAAQLVKNAALQVADDANFCAAVMEAKQYADRASSLRKTRWTPAARDMQGISDYLREYNPRYRQPTMRKLYEKSAC